MWKMVNDSGISIQFAGSMDNVSSESFSRSYREWNSHSLIQQDTDQKLYGRDSKHPWPAPPKQANRQKYCR